MRESRDRFVPVDTGALQRSGMVDRPERHGDEIQVKLSYGGAAQAYALAVHEYPSAHSPRSWRGGVRWSKPGTGPKYLETPLKIYGTMAGVVTYLVPPIRRALERICRGAA